MEFLPVAQIPAASHFPEAVFAGFYPLHRKSLLKHSCFLGK